MQSIGGHAVSSSIFFQKYSRRSPVFMHHLMASKMMIMTIIIVEVPRSITAGLYTSPCLVISCLLHLLCALLASSLS